MVTEETKKSCERGLLSERCYFPSTVMSHNREDEFRSREFSGLGGTSLPIFVLVYFYQISSSPKY